MRIKKFLSVCFIGLLLLLQYSSIYLNIYFNKWYLANFFSLVYLEFVLLVLAYQFSYMKRYISFTIPFCLIFTLNYLSYIEKVEGIENRIINTLYQLNIFFNIKDYVIYYSVYHFLITISIIGIITEILYKKKG